MVELKSSCRVVEYDISTTEGEDESQRTQESLDEELGYEKEESRQ